MKTAAIVTALAVTGASVIAAPVASNSQSGVEEKRWKAPEPAWVAIRKGIDGVTGKRPERRWRAPTPGAWVQTRNGLKFLANKKQLATRGTRESVLEDEETKTPADSEDSSDDSGSESDSEDNHKARKSGHKERRSVARVATFKKPKHTRSQIVSNEDDEDEKPKKQHKKPKKKADSDSDSSASSSDEDEIKKTTRKAVKVAYSQLGHSRRSQIVANEEEEPKHESKKPKKKSKKESDSESSDSSSDEEIKTRIRKEGKVAHSHNGHSRRSQIVADEEEERKPKSKKPKKKSKKESDSESSASSSDSDEDIKKKVRKHADKALKGIPGSGFLSYRDVKRQVARRDLARLHRSRKVNKGQHSESDTDSSSCSSSSDEERCKRRHIKPLPPVVPVNPHNGTYVNATMSSLD